MTKVRQDAWSHEDDLLLAETVLRHIREGGTQLDAFEEVGDRLNRTGAACGFRWNAIVRRKYDQAIEIAKKQRKQKKRAEQKHRRTSWQTYEPTAIHHEQGYSGSPVPTMDQTEPTDDENLEPAVDQPIVNSEVSTLNEDQHSTAESQSQSGSQLNLNHVISFLEDMQNNGAASERLQSENIALKQENNALQSKVKELETALHKLREEHQTIEEDYQSLMGIMDRARRMIALSDQQDEASSAFKMDKNGNLEKMAK